MDKHVKVGMSISVQLPGDDSPFKVLKLGSKSAFNILGCRRALRVGKEKVPGLQSEDSIRRRRGSNNVRHDKSASEAKRRTQLFNFFSYINPPEGLARQTECGPVVKEVGCLATAVVKEATLQETQRGGPAGSGGAKPRRVGPRERAVRLCLSRLGESPARRATAPEGLALGSLSRFSGVMAITTSDQRNGDGKSHLQ